MPRSFIPTRVWVSFWSAVCLLLVTMIGIPAIIIGMLFTLTMPAWVQLALIFSSALAMEFGFAGLLDAYTVYQKLLRMDQVFRTTHEMLIGAAKSGDETWH